MIPFLEFYCSAHASARSPIIGASEEEKAIVWVQKWHIYIYRVHSLLSYRDGLLYCRSSNPRRRNQTKKTVPPKTRALCHSCSGLINKFAGWVGAMQVRSSSNPKQPPARRSQEPPEAPSSPSRLQRSSHKLPDGSQGIPQAPPEEHKLPDRRQGIPQAPPEEPRSRQEHP